MSKDRLKLAIIGCGGMARAHLRAYGQIMEKNLKNSSFQRYAIL